MGQAESMESTDRLLIERLKRGDEQSYKFLYDQYYVFLCYIAESYVKDHFMAETIVGDTIFHLWEVRETLEISISLRAYLITSVRNRCINCLTSERDGHEVRLSDLLFENISGKMGSEQTPLKRLLDAELENEIKKIIEELPKECRNVFKKSRLEEKKYAEIAHELGISINTVKYHMKSALSTLQGKLEKYLLLLLLLFSKI